MGTGAKIGRGGAGLATLSATLLTAATGRASARDRVREALDGAAVRRRAFGGSRIPYTP